MSIGGTHRHDDVPQFNVKRRAEGLLNPELFEGHFAATLNLAFVFAAFAFFYLDSTLRTTVFKFYLAAHRPTFTKVIAQHNDHMRQVDTPVALGIFVGCGAFVPQIVVTVKVTRIGSLTVSADGETALLRSGLGSGTLYVRYVFMFVCPVAFRPEIHVIAGIKHSCKKQKPYRHAQYLLFHFPYFL